MNITVNAPVVPIFKDLGTYCQNDIPIALSTISSDGYVGTWSPPTISTAVIGTQAYIFTPNIGQCATTKTMNVTINYCPPQEIIVPDGFSPNGDQINDEFVIKNLADLYPNFSLEIYNRYGSVVYKGDINSPNWNGKSTQGLTVGDGLLPTGVYFYVIEFNDGNRKALQGRLYLSR